MFNSHFAIYLGREKEHGFSHFFVENNHFLVLVIPDGIDKEVGLTIISLIKERSRSAAINNLASFEEWINSVMRETNIPSGFSLAAGYVKDDIIYVKTIKDGQIYVQRNGSLVKIIDNNLSASGYVEPNDSFIFTTNSFMSLAQDELKKLNGGQKPNQIIESLTPSLKTKDDEGTIGLIVQFEKQIVEETEPEITEQVPIAPVTRPVPSIQSVPPVPSVPSQKEEPPAVASSNKQSFLTTLLSSFKKSTSEESSSKKSIFTIISVVVIFAILVWSVILGYQRRSEASVKKQIVAAKERIQQKLDQADEVAFLNMDRSVILIAEAKQELTKLKKEIGSKNQSDVKELEELISKKENQIVKKEDKPFEEFFDVTVENEKAKGDKLFQEGDSVAILDSANNSVYTLSLSKKSLDKQTASDIKSSTLVGMSSQGMYVFKEGTGIISIADNKAKKVIANDKEWGTISALAFYNGNLYLLDPSKNQIYKYLASDNGFSNKKDYLSSGDDLSSANSIAIDSSVYVGFPDHILKYTAGARDAFKTSFPNENVSIEKIVTNVDTEKVFAWDKKKGTIYILGKTGDYERQISSSILTKGSDVAVFENKAYILSGSHIYKLSLD